MRMFQEKRRLENRSKEEEKEGEWRSIKGRNKSSCTKIIKERVGTKQGRLLIIQTSRYHESVRIKCIMRRIKE